ncbi:AP2-associated protein kinase 1 [Trichinella nativa]|uniref:non-specific serine/threonine protein kinase n=1 Tax=Trichinella nativa TaxID=6335 RepID=A0A0V1L599_9BILA|nr:AP2-associated protein kinase 1 [Trichinella nativa]
MRKIFGKSHLSSCMDKDIRGQTVSIGGISVSIEGKIAEGGFSYVYLTRCNRTNTLMALKRQFINEPRLLEACRREAEITRTLGNHANIVHFIASSIQPLGDGVYEYLLLTKYYRGSVLQLMNERLVENRHLSVNEILHIFSSACCAVARLHQCQSPVIHRDLKVENLLLDDDGNCALCDFGSATTRVLSLSTHPYNVVEEEITRFTTLSYRSPEMVDLYSSQPITTKADIWALGVMLYKLCYFSLPFNESAFAIQNASFSFPSEPVYSIEIQALIAYMLEPDCNLRPDIFQVCWLLFQLIGRECPVKNLNNVAVPDFAHAVAALNKGQQRRAAEATTNNNGEPLTILRFNSAQIYGTTNLHQSDVSTSSTTVTPRQRPKPAQIPSPSITLLVESKGPWKKAATKDIPMKKSVFVECNPSVCQSQEKHSQSSDDDLPVQSVVQYANNNNNNNTPAAERSRENTVPLRSAGESGHRRNTSDPFVGCGGESNHLSAFRPYRSERQVCDTRNPFDIDDACFGHRFDELPRRRQGSLSNISNVRSENLTTEIDDSDPFRGAPIEFQSYDYGRPSSNRCQRRFHAGHYTKLVDTEESDTIFSKNFPKSTNTTTEEIDSVGSASDLQERMRNNSSSSSGSRMTNSSAELDDALPTAQSDDDRDIDDEHNLPSDPEQETSGQVPLLADDDDDGELAEMAATQLTFYNSTKHFSPTIFNTEVNDVFMNAPFDKTASSTSSPFRRPHRPDHDVSSGRLYSANDVKPAAITTSKLGSAFVNSSFQGDDVYRL